MEVCGIGYYNYVSNIVMLLVGVDLFSMFLVCDMIMLVLIIINGRFLLLCFIVLEFAVLLYILYE